MRVPTVEEPVPAEEEAVPAVEEPAAEAQPAEPAEPAAPAGEAETDAVTGASYDPLEDAAP